MTAPIFRPSSPPAILRVIIELAADGSVVRTWSEPIGLAAPVDAAAVGVAAAAAPNGAAAVSAGAVATRTGAGSTPAAAVGGSASPATSQRAAVAPAVAGSEPLVDEGAAVRQFVERFAAAGELWSGFVGMSWSDVLRSDGFMLELRSLQLLGVDDSISHLLRRGVKRCRSCRLYTDRQRREKHIKNPAGFCAELLRKDPDSIRRRGGEASPGPRPS